MRAPSGLALPTNGHVRSRSISTKALGQRASAANSIESCSIFLSGRAEETPLLSLDYPMMRACIFMKNSALKLWEYFAMRATNSAPGEMSVSGKSVFKLTQGPPRLPEISARACANGKPIDRARPPHLEFSAERSGSSRFETSMTYVGRLENLICTCGDEAGEEFAIRFFIATCEFIVASWNFKAPVGEFNLHFTRER